MTLPSPIVPKVSAEFQPSIRSDSVGFEIINKLMFQLRNELDTQYFDKFPPERGESKNEYSGWDEDF